MNTLRTGILLAGLTGLLLAFGYLLGRETGVLIALIVSIAMNAFTYWNGDKLVLSMHGAHPIARADAPEFHNLVAELAGRAGLPMPRLYVMDNPQPNAFATGRDPEHAALAATTGLLDSLSHDEVRGVMAHELAHVKHRDTLTMTVTATIAGAISMLANFAYFFGGSRDRNSPARSAWRPRHGDRRAACRHAGADGSEPYPRIRGRPRRRGNLRHAARPRLGAHAHRPRRASYREREC